MKQDIDYKGFVSFAFGLLACDDRNLFTPNFDAPACSNLVALAEDSFSNMESRIYLFYSFHKYHDLFVELKY